MSNLMKHTLQIVLGGGALVAAITWLSGGCGERIGPDQETGRKGVVAEQVETTLVVEETAMVFEDVSGTIFSARHTTISSKILARIEAIPVRAGDEIEAGTVVVRLDSRDLDARLAAALVDVTRSRAAASRASHRREPPPISPFPNASESPACTSRTWHRSATSTARLRPSAWHSQNSSVRNRTSQMPRWHSHMPRSTRRWRAA